MGGPATAKPAPVVTPLIALSPSVPAPICGCLQKVEAMAHEAGRIHNGESFMAGAMQLSAMAETQMRRLSQ